MTIPDVRECPKCHTLRFRVVRSDLGDSGEELLKWQCGRCGFEVIEAIRH
ncbi:MAG: hypothetical protein JRN20_07415 [Nitrososphaerota archaeon]|nr:hypothetical protein [Nitrososphaerota archaeon]